jgi:hypothetical protein
VYKYRATKSSSRLKRADLYYLFVVGSMGAEYFSRILFAFPIFSFLGAIESLKRFRYSTKNLFYIAAIALVNVGILVKRLLFTPELPLPINVLFISQVLFASIFLIAYLRKNDVTTSFLLVTSFFYLPHFFGLITGLANRELDGNGILRFGGFVGDPNYLSVDLIFALASQVYLIFANYSKSRKIIASINLVASLYLLALTASRTGVIAFALVVVLLLAARIFEKSSLFSMLKFFSALVIVGGVLVWAVNNIDRVGYIYYRIFETEGGGGLLDNERFIVWGISLDLIQSSGLFSGYGRAEFLANQYSFLSHNVFLDMGVIYGKYTFYAHVMFFVVGMILFLAKFLRGWYKFGINTQTYFFALCIAELVMMSSISVSEKYIYWFLMAVVLVYGYAGEDAAQEKTI